MGEETEKKKMQGRCSKIRGVDKRELCQKNQPTVHLFFFLLNLEKSAKADLYESKLQLLQ